MEARRTPHNTLNGTRFRSGPEQRVISVPARDPLVSGWVPPSSRLDSQHSWTCVRLTRGCASVPRTCAVPRRTTSSATASAGRGRPENHGLLSGAGRDCGPVGDSAVAPAIAVSGAAFGRAYPGSTCPAPPALACDSQNSTVVYLALYRLSSRHDVALRTRRA
jgi:hypothetical protein